VAEDGRQHVVSFAHRVQQTSREGVGRKLVAVRQRRGLAPEEGRDRLGLGRRHRARHPFLVQQGGLQPVLHRDVAEFVRQDEQSNRLWHLGQAFTGNDDVPVQCLCHHRAACHAQLDDRTGLQRLQQPDEALAHRRSAFAVGAGRPLGLKPSLLRTPQHVDDVLLAPGRGAGQAGQHQARDPSHRASPPIRASFDAMRLLRNQRA
jgi:hypothetical protein